MSAELNLLPDEYEWYKASSDDGFQGSVENELTLLRRLSDLRNKLATERRWIPVGEGLPETHGMDCAIRINGGIYHKYSRWGLYEGNGVWSGDGGYRFDTHAPAGLHNVTHWLQLPAPPLPEEAKK